MAHLSNVGSPVPVGFREEDVEYHKTMNLLARLSADFTAILLGYNLPRNDARRIAQEAVEPVREYFNTADREFRLIRLRK